MGRKNLFTSDQLKKLKTFACRDEYAKREDGSYKEMNDATGRSNFYRDHNRILYSKSFRRLAHKTQVYLTCENTPVYNDHTRTRLTHTLEVAHIARTMAKYLSMNEELIEAIAFGHDIGHTPFGHAGEHQLDIFLNGKKEFHPAIKHRFIACKFKESFLSSKIPFEEKFNFGDFRHNFQSVRLLTFLDEYKSHYQGLNLTYQCLDGILRHTTLRNINNNRICDYPETSSGLWKKIINYKNFEPSIESKIIGLADEIAQVCHDLYDAVDLEVISFHELHDEMLSDVIIRAREHSSTLGREVEFGNIKTDEEECNRKLCSLFTSYFTIKTAKEIGNILLQQVDANANKSDIIKKLPKNPFPKNDFKKTTRFKDDLVINNYGVNRMDNKGSYIIRQLYNAYLTDPRQLPDSELKRYLYCKRQAIELNENRVRKWFNDSNGVLGEDGKLTEKERKLILKIITNDNDGTSFRKLPPEFNTRITPLLLQDGDYVRLIVDYIASMTDTFAEREMALLYGC